MANKSRVLILGGNFAGLGAAQKIRDCAGDSVAITVVDRKAYLDYIPNIPLEIFEGRDPAVTMFFANHGRIPNWGLPLAEWSAETVKIQPRLSSLVH